MSGGVDSSVAAGLLLEAGYEVTGLFLCRGWSTGDGGASRGCCSPEDAADARRAAEKLGIELLVLDAGDAFKHVVENFVAEYERGRTPNPCIHCNRSVKFARLIERADAVGCRYVATGHHARIVGEGAGAHIRRAAATDKDQSYALLAVAREHLGRTLLPIGEVASKQRVREIARSLGLDVHDKRDSQEICFVPNDDYVAFLHKRAGAGAPGRPGKIVNATGDVLGTHDGYERFTIGQRRGLRVAAGTPMYVTAIDPHTATVTIGPREQIRSQHLAASEANWHCDVPEAFEASVQIRYSHPGTPGRVRITGLRTFEVDFHHPVDAVTPGQAAGVYDQDRLMGGGWIE